MEFDFVLHLDPGFQPETDAHDTLDADITVFQGGEQNIRIRNMCRDDFLEGSSVIVTHRLNSSNAIMQLLMARDALRRLGALSVSAFIPYFPYARQDRVCNTGEALSLSMFADMLNYSGNFNPVYIFDPHSDVTGAVVDDPRIITNAKLVRFALDEIAIDGVRVADTAIVVPDGGAIKKINKLITALNWKGGVVDCTKHRDLATNQPGNAKVLNPDEVDDKVCVVIDDICDGGRTFVNLADELAQHSPRECRLVVSHGIFSYGTDQLRERYSRIYTTDSFRWDAGTEELGEGVKVLALSLDGSVLEVECD